MKGSNRPRALTRIVGLASVMAGQLRAALASQAEYSHITLPYGTNANAWPGVMPKSVFYHHRRISKNKPPHQGAKECQRRVRQGLGGLNCRK